MFPPYPGRVSSSASSRPGRTERLLSYLLVIFLVLSVVSFFAIIIGTWTGMTQEDFSEGIWPLVAATPLVGLPLAVAALIAILIVGAVKRSRTARSR